MALLEALESFDAVSLVRFILLLAVTLGLATSVQRLFFHPLSKYPGPWLNAISPLPEVVAIVAGRQFAYHKRLHEKYGPVLRVSPDELIFCGPNAWDDIYGNKPGKPDMEKSPLTAGGLPPNMPARAMTQAKWDEHARQRKAWSYPFSNTALMGQEPLIQMHVAKFIRELQKFAAAGKAVNIADWLTFCTFDVIGELCFAEPFGCLDSGGATEWSTSVYNIAIAGTLDQATRRVAGVNTWLQRTMARWLIPVKYRHWREAHFRKSRETATRRLADKDRDHKDFVYYVLRNGTEAPLISELELAMNTALFIGAGSETSAFALTAWVNLMLRNPGPYKKLVNEIRGTIRSAADISWATVKELAYLEAVVNETLRLGMPAPSNLNRVAPEGGAYIDGNWVPGGTTVSVSTWAATHLAQNFEDPLSFIPERFLKSEEHRFARDNKLAWQPFSYGPRGCIGKNLANIEMRLIICQLLFHFDLEAPGGQEEVVNEQWTLEGDMKNMKSWLVWEKPALWVRLREVSRA